MTDSKSKDHWKFLGQELGMAPPMEAEEEAVTAESRNPRANCRGGSNRLSRKSDRSAQPKPLLLPSQLPHPHRRSHSQLPALPHPNPSRPIIGESWQARLGLRSASPNRRNRRSRRTAPVETDFRTTGRAARTAATCDQTSRTAGAAMLTPDPGCVRNRDASPSPSEVRGSRFVVGYARRLGCRVRRDRTE